MDQFVTALGETVTTVALWGSVVAASSIVTIGVLVGFGVHVLRKAIHGIHKGKGRI